RVLARHRPAGRLRRGQPLLPGASPPAPARARPPLPNQATGRAASRPARPARSGQYRPGLDRGRAGMSHLLLLGATGFLGTHIHAAARHHPRIERVSTLGRDRCDLHTIAVAELADLLRQLAPAAIVNATGRLDGTSTDLITANTLATAKLIDAIAVATPATRLVRLGSAGEYGPVPPGQAVTEDHPTNPVSAYGHSHLAATGLLHHATTTGTVNGVTLRVFNPIGPGTGKSTLLGAVAARLRRALTTGSQTIHTGPLTTHRDFIDVRDVATAA